MKINKKQKKSEVYIETDNEDSTEQIERIFVKSTTTLHHNNVRDEAWIKQVKCAIWAHELCSVK